MKINGHDRFIEDKKIKCFWQQLGTKGVCVCDCVCWSLWHAEKLLFSCLCSKVTVYRFICWNGPKSCQIQPKLVNSLPSQTQACALFLNLQAKPSQARNPFFVIQAKPSRLDLAWLVFGWFQAGLMTPTKLVQDDRKTETQADRQTDRLTERQKDR